MKKLAMILAGSAVLAGCATTNTQDDTMRVSYNCPMDTNITVEYLYDGEIARMQDDSGRIVTMIITPAASGAYYTNHDGFSIHTKADYAVVEFVKGNPISCEIWKGDKK